jgi:hypothetical protein
MHGVGPIMKRYCELDSLAMVMIYQAISKWQAISEWV